MSDCGTYGGYQAHRKRDEQPCGFCTEANRAYRRNHYATSAKTRERQRAANALWQRAARELIRRHRAEFMRLCIELEDES